jgi:hypothetical protein
VSKFTFSFRDFRSKIFRLREKSLRVSLSGDGEFQSEGVILVIKQVFDFEQNQFANSSSTSATLEAFLFTNTVHRTPKWHLNSFFERMLAHIHEKLALSSTVFANTFVLFLSVRFL